MKKLILLSFLLIGANAMQKERAERKGLWQDANPINPEL